MNHLLFQGNSTKNVTGWLGCFEKRTGDSSWKRELENTLKVISDSCSFAAGEHFPRKGDHGETDDAAQVLQMMSSAQAAISKLIMRMNPNYDRFSVRRGFGWTRKGLEYFRLRTDQSIIMDFRDEKNMVQVSY